MSETFFSPRYTDRRPKASPPNHRILRSRRPGPTTTTILSWSTSFRPNPPPRPRSELRTSCSGKPTWWSPATNSNRPTADGPPCRKSTARGTYIDFHHNTHYYSELICFEYCLFIIYLFIYLCMYVFFFLHFFNIKTRYSVFQYLSLVFRKREPSWPNSFCTYITD